MKKRHCIWLHYHISPTSKFLKEGPRDSEIPLLSYLLGTTLHDTTMIQLSLLRKWLGHLLLFRFLGGPEVVLFLRLTPSAMLNASAERSQPPSLAPSTAPFQMIWWRKSGSSENTRWMVYQMICFSQDKPMESNWFDMSNSHVEVWKITISEHPTLKNQPLGLLWLRLLPKVFQHTFDETSIFWKCG